MTWASQQSFADRHAAGRLLAQALQRYAARHPVIIALPRGGVPVAFEVAAALRAPLDVRVVRKVGMPGDPECGMGAVAEGGYVHLSEEAVAACGVGERELVALVAAKQREVEARVRAFRGGRPPSALRGRTVILVDDGIATGGTVLAALAAIEQEEPRETVLAVPVAALDTLQVLAPRFDDVVCLASPRTLHSVGQWYDDFAQVQDAQVIELLARSRAAEPSRA